MISVADIEHARERLRPYLPPTPLEEANSWPNLWLKLENANRTHSFKCRGALNALLTMSDSARARGVVAASSGNHAQGVAFAAHLLGVRARIVMPESAARRKVAGVRRLGAEPILFGDTYDEAEAEARRLCREEGATWLSPYADPAVIAGAGTVGLEILEQLPSVGRVVVPVGGGGLISGIALAVKAARPDIEIVGVNALVSPDMYNVLYELDLPLNHDSLADALPGAIEEGSITRRIVSEVVDRIVLVSEDDLRLSMQIMAFDQGWIAEGGGAASLAAVENGQIELDRPTVVVISGGNVDVDVLRDVLGV